MLNANNEINVKKEERKHSWSTVFAWLYLKTIGRILPKRWNRWAENILYYDKTTANNEVQTDAFKTVDESAQVDLKPEVAEKESQSVVISKDGGIQTDEVALCVEKVDKSVEVNLKPEVAEKESQSEIMSEDEGIYSEVSGEPTNESFDAKLNGGFIDEEYNSMEEICTEDDKPLKLQLAEVEGDYIELKSITDQIEKEFSDELEELRNETEKNSVEIKKKDARINILTALNEALKQDIKKIETRSNEQQQMAEIYMKLNELLLNVTEIPEKTLQLNNQEQQEEKKSLENKILELQKQVQTLEGNKEWELAGIDGTLKETFLTIMELLAQQLLNNQEQSVKEQKLEELTLPYNDQAHQMERLQLENLSLGVKNGKLLSVIERSITEEAEVRKMDEQVEKNQYRLINQIVKLEGALKEKGEQLKESQRTLESLEYRLESLESQSATTKAQQRKDSSHQTSTKSMAKGEADLSNQKKEWEADSNKKAKEIENLKGSKRKLEKNLQETKKELAEQKELAERATKEVTKLTSKIKNVLDEVNKLQEEKRNIEEQLKIMQQQLLNDQERQRMGEELKDVDKRLEDIEKTKKSQEYTKVQRKPLQDKNLEHFLSDRNMGLKKDFPEFKEKNFLLNFLRETVKFLSNKQDDKFQGRELLDLFKSNLKELAKEVIENRVKEVVTNKGNKYYQVSKNIDKELLDGTICRDKLIGKLSHSVEQCMKKLGLDVKDAITITNSIVDKLCDKENNNKSPALREIVVRDLTEARMKTFLEKVREINLVPNNTPNSFMSHTNNTAHVLSLGNVRTGS